MLLHVYGVDARWLKLVRQADERIVISSCQTVRNTKTISTVIKIMKKKNLISFSAKIVPEMSGSLGFQSSKRRPFHFQKSFHFIDMEMLTCIIFQAFLLLYLTAYKTSFLKITCPEWTHVVGPHGTDVGFSNIYTCSSTFLNQDFRTFSTSVLLLPFS